MLIYLNFPQLQTKTKAWSTRWTTVEFVSKYIVTPNSRLPSVERQSFHEDPAPRLTPTTNTTFLQIFLAQLIYIDKYFFLIISPSRVYAPQKVRWKISPSVYKPLPHICPSKSALKNKPRGLFSATSSTHVEPRLQHWYCALYTTNRYTGIPN